ncbi:MAG: SRPBCC domain-containing protein [Planctomycetota bacterium]
MSEMFGEGWAEFTRRIFINVDRQTAFANWSQSGNLEKWYFEKAAWIDSNGNLREPADDVRSGDRCRWKWHGWDHIHEGEVTYVVAPVSIEFSFPPAGNVVVRFEEAGPDRTELVLTQSGIPHSTEKEIKDFYYGCSQGWSFWMLNCKAFLEHGIVLNELDHPYKGDQRLFQLVNH